MQDDPTPPRPERDVILENQQRALDACGGNCVKAAKLLGVSHKTVYNRLAGKSKRLAKPITTAALAA